jgi:hypothetical protein
MLIQAVQWRYFAFFSFFSFLAFLSLLPFLSLSLAILISFMQLTCFQYSHLARQHKQIANGLYLGLPCCLLQRHRDSQSQN